LFWYLSICGCIWQEVCFGSYFSSVYCGRIWQEFVLVPTFPATTSLHLVGILFWFLFFQPLCGRIWREVCFGSYFPAFIVVLSGGNFVFGSYFPAPISYVSQFTCFDCIYIYVRYFSLGPCDINGPRFSDGNTSGIQPQSIQERLGMSAFRLFTAHQLMIYRDHNAQSRSYDSVSMFGMCPPELVGVFQQTKFFI